MDNIVIKQLAPCAERIKQMCREYLSKVTNLAIATGYIPPNRKPNRVDLKKALLDATKGKSITSFIKFMDSQDRRHLLTMIHMECPVTCPSKNIMLPPVESMPRNVMRSAKKLRNFFGVPEAQICRGCVKRVRCRKYQQIERDLPDLSDIAAILIGVYSICKLNLKESPLVVAQSSLKELDSVIAITGTLMSYIQSILTKPDPVTLDEKERNRLLQKHRKMVELKQLEILKEKAFNLPKHFNVTPAEHTYMTSFQRDMYKKISKPLNKRNEDDDIWVVDRGDTTLSDDPDDTFKGLSKLNEAHLYTLPNSVTADPVDPKHVEQLHPGIVQFRMNYDTPMGGDLDIVRYDIKQDSFIQGVKVNAKGKVVIDLEKHVSSPNPHIDIAKGLEAYRPISENVASKYQSLVKRLEIDSLRLPFLKRVNYDFGSQSSGGIDQPNDKNFTNEASHLEDLITALHS